MNDPFGDPIPATGLGNWGKTSYQCPDGYWCGTGQVQPFSCSFSGAQCPPGTDVQPSAHAYITLGIIVAAMFVLFFFLDWRTGMCEIIIINLIYSNSVF